jgi:hypothetical protein
MNRTRAVLMACVMVATSLSGAAWADRGGHFGGGHGGGYGYHGGHHYGGLGWVPGLVLGSALVWAATRPPAVVYQEPVRTVIVQEPEPLVVAPPVSNQWWYYCRSAGAYYPYVTSCSTGWERVAATP